MSIERVYYGMKRYRSGIWKAKRVRVILYCLLMKKLKKLTLKKETIAKLDQQNLSDLNGGYTT